jgi:hypothetical protein
MADGGECSECARGYPPELIQGHWLHLQTCLKGEIGTFPCRDKQAPCRDDDDDSDAQAG